MAVKGGSGVDTRLKDMKTSVCRSAKRVCWYAKNRVRRYEGQCKRTWEELMSDMRRGVSTLARLILPWVRSPPPSSTSASIIIFSPPLSSVIPYAIRPIYPSGPFPLPFPPSSTFSTLSPSLSFLSQSLLLSFPVCHISFRSCIHCNATLNSLPQNSWPIKRQNDARQIHPQPLIHERYLTHSVEHSDQLQQESPFSFFCYFYLMTALIFVCYN